MTTVVTGATGHLGRGAIESLLQRGVPAEQIVAVGRSVEKVKDLAERGVAVKAASYDDPASLREAFAGADKLLFVSGSEVGKRVEQHQNVIDAAKAAGISKIVYTSAPHADTSDMILAGEHVATERALVASGIPSVFLRNGWYIENYNLPSALENGLTGAAGDGKISIVPRAELAEAAAAAIHADGVEQQVYELGGEAVTLGELAAEVSRQSGRQVTYTNLSPQEYTDFLVNVGLPKEAAAVYADSDRAASNGALLTGTEDLEKLLGRPATRIADVVRGALA